MAPNDCDDFSPGISLNKQTTQNEQPLQYYLQSGGSWLIRHEPLFVVCSLCYFSKCLMPFRRRKVVRRLAGRRRLGKRQFGIGLAGAGIAAGYGFYRNAKAMMARNNVYSSGGHIPVGYPRGRGSKKQIIKSIGVGNANRKRIAASPTPRSRKRVKGFKITANSLGTQTSGYAGGRRHYAPAKFLGTFGNGRPFHSPGRQYGFNGSVLKVESGGQAVDAECVYLGHAIAMTHVIKGFFRAMLSSLFAEAGLPIVDWATGPFYNADNYLVNLIYRSQTSSMSNTLLGITFTTGFTFEQMAGHIWTLWQASVSGGTPFDFYNATLIHNVTDSGAATHTRLMSTLFLANHDIEIMVKSSLTVQNATLAGPVTEASLSGDSALLAGRENKNNIYSNPLVGKMYSSFAKGGHWRNGFLEKFRKTYATGSHNSTANQAFLSDPNTGIITAIANTDLSVFWKKPPPSWAWEDKPTIESIQMNPAEMKKDVWMFHSRMSVGNFTNSFAQFLNDGVTSGTTSPTMVPLGFAKMLAVEKRLDDRTEVNVITLHYEVGQVYSIKLHKRAMKASLPIVLLNG